MSIFCDKKMQFLIKMAAIYKNGYDYRSYLKSPICIDFKYPFKYKTMPNRQKYIFI